MLFAYRNREMRKDPCEIGLNRVRNSFLNTLEK